MKVYARHLVSTSYPTFPGSINLDEDTDEINSFVDLERLIGKKVTKEKLKKRKTSDDVVLRLSSQLDEIKKLRRRMYDE